MSKIQKIQAILGIDADGIWGPKSQAALIDSPHIKEVQRAIGAKEDGIWGRLSQAILMTHFGEGINRWFGCKASSFADPADVKAFIQCKRTGKSDIQCFAVGDNGIGQFGRITAQEGECMVAIHKDDMIARWGYVPAAAHRKVEVEVGGKNIFATVEDRISAPGRIDLNPACAKRLGLKPPFVVDCNWRWA